MPSLQTVERWGIAGGGTTAGAALAPGRRSDGVALAVAAVVADQTPPAVSGTETGNPAVAFGYAA